MTSITKDKPGCLSAIFPFLKRSKETPDAATLPFRVRDDFLSPAESSFYRVLKSLLGNQWVIQAKVRLADIFFVARPNENIAYLNKIVQRHLDFLVCDAVTMQPFLGIELDDTSHQRSDRMERDQFVEQVFQAAGLPLLRVPVRPAYNTREIEDQIRPFLIKAGISPVADQPGDQPAVALPPLCPKCGIPMVIRTVAQGVHKGKQFYGCTNYPRCRELKPIKA